MPAPISLFRFSRLDSAATSCSSGCSWRYCFKAFSASCQRSCGAWPWWPWPLEVKQLEITNGRTSPNLFGGDFFKRTQKWMLEAVDGASFCFWEVFSAQEGVPYLSIAPANWTPFQTHRLWTQQNGWAWVRNDNCNMFVTCSATLSLSGTMHLESLASVPPPRCPSWWLTYADVSVRLEVPSPCSDHTAASCPVPFHTSSSLGCTKVMQMLHLPRVILRSSEILTMSPTRALDVVAALGPGSKIYADINLRDGICLWRYTGFAPRTFMNCEAGKHETVAPFIGLLALWAPSQITSTWLPRSWQWCNAATIILRHESQSLDKPGIWSIYKYAGLLSVIIKMDHWVRIVCPEFRPSKHGLRHFLFHKCPDKSHQKGVWSSGEVQSARNAMQPMAPRLAWSLFHHPWLFICWTHSGQSDRGKESHHPTALPCTTPRKTYWIPSFWATIQGKLQIKGEGIL